MAEKYFQISSDLDPLTNELTVKVVDVKLECLTGGDDLLKKYKCRLDKEENLHVKKGFFLSEVPPQKITKPNRNYNLEEE